MAENMQLRVNFGVIVVSWLNSNNYTLKHSKLIFYFKKKFKCKDKIIKQRRKENINVTIFKYSNFVHLTYFFLGLHTP